MKSEMNMHKQNRRVRLLALVTALLLGTGQASVVAMASDGQALLIRDAMVFDGTGRAAYPASVLVQDGKIAAIGSGLTAPKGARVVNARGQALLPGLFDLQDRVLPLLKQAGLRH